ncbi:hypothetical protein DL768_000183 [Monosporascus sp. mg162]|nr:hypothetical protein DL768_000183 [Monosporascus sp. mg162]
MAVKTIPVDLRYSDSCDFSWPTVANANFGVDAQWHPAGKTACWEKLIKDAITYALGFVPFSRLVLAIAFPFGWTLIRSVEAFFTELRNAAPEVDLPAKGRKTPKLTPDNWQKLDQPSQGCTDASLASAACPLGSISIGKKERPDPEREASAEVFPNTDKPVSLDEDVLKHDAFLAIDIIMELPGADVMWKPIFIGSDLRTRSARRIGSS